MSPLTRREAATAMLGAGLGLVGAVRARAATAAPSLILHNARIATMDRGRPHADAVAIRDGRFSVVGTAHDVMATRGPGTRVIDCGGRRLIPGLQDNHTHVIRGGLTYNLELRWEGVRSLADAMAMLRAQVAVTPSPHWVRVVGGFSATQFAEKRLPTLEEINRVAPDTPVLILHLYDRALLNAAALRAIGYTKETPDPPAGAIMRNPDGTPTGLLLANPYAGILYATLTKLPKLPFDQQVNSTRHFMRELNRLGITSLIDAGGGSQVYPDDYAVVEKLDRDGQLTVRMAYNLFPQKPKQEREDFVRWIAGNRYRQGNDFLRLNGAGEVLVASALDFEDFRMPRPELPPGSDEELESVVRLLAQNRWPWRMHATYDETISRSLDVFEKVNAQIPFKGLHWFFDHAETISPRNIDRVAALGGGIAVQHRMAFQGEYFVERYGAKAAEHTPPIRRILSAGVKVSAGTDATRVASYDPWTSLAWLVTGRTVGGLRLYPRDNLLDRETALRMWTENVTWFSGDEETKGRIKAGQLADLALLDRDYFTVAADDIRSLESVLTIVGGKPVYGAGTFAALAPPPPPVLPDWSPVRTFGGYHKDGRGSPVLAERTGGCGCAAPCAVHGHNHSAAAAAIPASDLKSFWGALGCACWAV